jgi:hypothetical protein
MAVQRIRVNGPNVFSAEELKPVAAVRGVHRRALWRIKHQ